MGLQVWLPLNGNLTSKGLKKVTAVRSGATVNADGPYGSCYSFASKNYIGLDAKNVNNHKYPKISIAVWAYPTQNSSTEQQIIGCWESGGGGIVFKNSKFGCSAYISGSYKTCYASTTVTLNAWHHVCMVYNGQNGIIYVDGVEQGQVAAVGNITYHSTCPWQISGNPGATSFGSGTFIGRVSDLRIYDHALSPSEVKNIAHNLILHYPLNNDWKTANWLLPSTEKTITRSSGNTFVDFTYKTALKSCSETNYKVNFWAKGSVNNMQLDIYFRNTSGSAYALTDKITLTDNWKYYSLSLSGTPANMGLFRVRCYKGTANDVIYLRNMQLVSNNMPIDEIIDISGYKKNGSITGNLVSKLDSNKYLNCLYIDNGLTSNIITSELTFNKKYVTLNIWFKSSSDNAQTIISDSLAENAYIMQVTTSGQFSGGFIINETAYLDTCTSTTALDGKWHMLTLTYDGNNIKRYYDGNLESTTVVSYSTGLTSPKYLYIGTDGNTNKCIETCLSDFRIYATALTDNDIQELYYNSFNDNTGNLKSRNLE